MKADRKELITTNRTSKLSIQFPALFLAIYDETGSKIVSFRYDAWGNFNTDKANTTVCTDTFLRASLFRYRSYIYDYETSLYYLQSRYYDAEASRFINMDDVGVVTATPMGLTDKNLYAYCDNNPIMRADTNGEFWLISVGIGLVTQYVGDIIGNLIDGKQGSDIFKPTSSIGEYIASGVENLIPGAGVVASLVCNSVSEGIVAIENTISGKETSIVESITNIGLGTLIDIGSEKISNKITDVMRSKIPINYATYANTLRQKNPNLTREQISLSLQNNIQNINKIIKSISNVINFVRDTLPY